MNASRDRTPCTAPSAAIAFIAPPPSTSKCASLNHNTTSLAPPPATLSTSSSLSSFHVALRLGAGPLSAWACADRPQSCLSIDASGRSWKEDSGVLGSTPSDNNNRTTSSCLAGKLRPPAGHISKTKGCSRSCTGSGVTAILRRNGEHRPRGPSSPRPPPNAGPRATRIRYCPPGI
eukprot:1909067-Rhodomonas_salina.5